MTIETMKQALEALEDPIAFAKGHAAKAALRTAIEAAEKQEPVATYTAPVQVSPTDFVDMVMDKEDAIGKPIFWAEWPNREKNNG